jgi:diguanylate cyclase (GGDEF)-like protein
MSLDYTSMLLATAFSGLCLSLTMLAFWMSARHERFMVTWAAGLMIIVAHVFAYWVYVQAPGPIVGVAVSALLPLGCAIVFVATLQFVEAARPLRTIAALCGGHVLLVSVLMFSGLDGLALVIQNAAAASFLALNSWVYWRYRDEAPPFMGILAVLYSVVAASFALCGLVLIAQGQMSIGHAPDNWAERLNIVVAVACMTGMGALTLALNQSRIASQHQAEALTDPLTGLLNRRALFKFHDQTRFDGFKAIVMFDLDRFKQTNDLHGHSVGDEVIRRFAAALGKHSRPRDEAVRLGGEEFALVMTRVTPDKARRVAERIRHAFSSDQVHGVAGPFYSTVSAGIGFGDAAGATLEEVLGRADRALYQAKNAGRNRVVADDLRLVG